MEEKTDVQYAEHVDEAQHGVASPVSAHHGKLTEADIRHGDAALAVIGDERVELTDEDNKRIRRKTDLYLLPILIWMYLLQITDKSTLGYSAIFGLQTDTHLTGSQYSLIASISPIAQLAWQPFSSIVILKVPPRICVPIFILGWGISQAAMAACHDYSSLMATRFFLGLFEAGCLPMFSVITSNWYRRSEQPMRVAAWYSMNGIGTVVTAALSYGLGHIKSDALLPWQIIFLFFGLLTVITSPLIWWRLENNIATARFLNDEDKAKAIERLRANQTGTGTSEFKLRHVIEVLLEPKTYIFIAMTVLLNLGAQVAQTFGPLILAGFGFDKYTTSLLNIPFGVLQFLTILAGSYAAFKWKYKSAILAGFMLPVIAGIAILYAVPRTHADQGPLMFGYYLFSFLFAGNPLIVAWVVGNTAGSTKKSVMMAAYQAASSTGNIVGPLLFTSDQAPAYLPGLRAVLSVFCVLVLVVGLQVANLVILNKLQQKKRVRNGKRAVLTDHSMQNRYTGVDEENEEASGPRLGEAAFLDKTDRENDEFLYIY
ncbi:MFS general substrate transporter [Rhizodiscina lignyota]|uniref:MFS general substrate transporter n=1 Tax=Rhizodiscina lignyota TaxID=1504668 RepID=A0A9P4M6K9_9PEZI|nr:MFS general substrate transporter [Rhizodiscina lignyota]